MFFRRFFRFALVAILLFGMCGLISSTAYRSGWSQGVTAGQGGEDGIPGNLNGGPFSRGIGFHGHGIFSFFWFVVAGFFKFLLFFFFIGLIFRLLFGGRRGLHRSRPFGHWKGAHWGGGHGHHRGGSHGKGDDFKGQRPPWYDDSDGEPVMKA